jgi:hypothetical protein
MWKGTFSPHIFTLHGVILIAPLASKTGNCCFEGSSYKVRYILRVLGAKPIWDPCNKQKVLNFSYSSNLNGQAKICMPPTLLMASQAVIFCSWIFAVQVIPYIIEGEIMEHMGERKTFSTILQMKNR